MKADLTRSTFRPHRHYSGVRMQQGRVQLDADWNEQLDIDAHLENTTRRDVIGLCGAPKADAGFGIRVTPDGSDLMLTPGRIYVNGVLCELVVRGSGGCTDRPTPAAPSRGTVLRTPWTASRMLR